MTVLRALFGLAFAAAPGHKPLTLHRLVTRRSVLQKVRRHPARRPGAPTVCRRTVSGSISLPFRGAFHLSLTVLCAIGRQKVFSLGGWSPRLPTGFHVSRGTQEIAPTPSSFRLRGCHALWRSFPAPSAKKTTIGEESTASSGNSCNPAAATPVGLARRRFGLFPVRSPLLRESRLISFPRGTEMFHFPRFPSLPYGFRQRCRDITPGGLPHSEIPGSTPACGSPGRIGACPVLLRPLAPRHPPYAFVRLTTLLNTGNTRDGALPFSCPVQFSRCKQRKTTL